MCTGIELAQFAFAASSQMQQQQQAKAQTAALGKLKPPAITTPSATPPKKPDTGFGSTLITGPQGLAAGSQNIGASTLLGQ